MDTAIFRIALAGYLHDIGKLTERAKIGVSQDYIDNNGGLYQPTYKNRKTHKHALHTAHFIEKFIKQIPEGFLKGEHGSEDSFVKLAAMHHKPESLWQWIIAIADRVSNGFDRDEFENYNQEIKTRDYSKTRLLSIFEGLSTSDKWKDDELDSHHFRYLTKELSPLNLFPAQREFLGSLTDADPSAEYNTLYEGFTKALEHLVNKDNIALWFEHFESLFMIYTSHIPAATVGFVLPDVSLYDHCRTTSAIASALYLYHKETGTLEIQKIRDEKENKFLIINGDFYGVQDFIFTEGSSTGKFSAKLLRGRSFSVSLISELAADMLCREIGLPPSSVILNAAGKFTILASNTNTTRTKIKSVEETVNSWLIKNYYGQSAMGLSFIEASCSDFTSRNFPFLWENLSKEAEKRKFSKIDLKSYGGCIGYYLDSFDNELGVCPFCGKRPSHRDAFFEMQDTYSCKICHDHIYIGENIVKEARIAITTTNADLAKERLLEPVFGKYQISFKVSGKLEELARAGTLLKYWDIGMPKDGNITKEITARFINGYVPQYSNEDNYDNRFLFGRKNDKNKQELIDGIKNGSPKTFGHIAKAALNATDWEDKFTGIEALGTLKADIDNLGLLFACGVRETRQTLSRFATLSRQVNNFFSLFLPYTLKTDKRFKDIYTVFAGGDDLFLIGPWNRIIEFSKYLHETFNKYVCMNADVTLSAGMSINKPGEPIVKISENAEHALKASKLGGRNSITLFGETISWDDFIQLEQIRDTIYDWLESEKINNAMLYRFNELIQMVREESAVLEAKGGISMEDMECFKWRSKLKYAAVRNVGKGLKGVEKESAVDEVLNSAGWLGEYKGAVKIPLWQILYNIR